VALPVDETSKPLQQQLATALERNEQLKNALGEVERRVAEAQTAKEEMEHLVYALSHDFRQPLRTMSGYAQMLERKYALDDDSTEMTAFIVKAAKEMSALIEDALKYSRIKTAPERTTINLGALVRWAAANLESKVRENSAQITCGDLPDVAVNESQFVQLFEQLFTNALNFRSTDPPKIEVTAEENADEYLVSMRDNGIGIEPKYYEAIFVPFKRLHGREIPGTGLGLATCRKIVRAHGGRIWVESNEPQGSVFRFTVPL